MEQSQVHPTWTWLVMSFKWGSKALNHLLTHPNPSPFSNKGKMLHQLAVSFTGQLSSEPEICLRGERHALSFLKQTLEGWFLTQVKQNPGLRRVHHNRGPLKCGIHYNTKLKTSSNCWLQKWLYCSFNVIFKTSILHWIKWTGLKGRTVTPPFCATTTKKYTGR